MFMQDKVKRIQGYRFYRQSNGYVKVTSPDNKEQILEPSAAEKLYIRLYAGKRVDSMIDEVIAELGLDKKTLHLWSIETLKNVERGLRGKLYKENITLPMQSVVTLRYGIHISGNVDGITANIICWLFKRGWHKIEISYAELKNYFKHHKNAKLYKLGEYWSVVEIPKSKVETIDLGNKTEHYGYGSCSSIGLRSVTLWQDKKYNLCIDERLVVLD